uniref:HTH myb-type domain-containing protein n=1 Tax=Kalanchoe fedtschenkoi TaxID=63787 RepID=A0A7N0UCA4_KALFE
MDPIPTRDFLKFDDPPRRKLQRLADQVAGLEAERRKIEAFKRELPLCLDLLNDAVERFREELRKCGDGGAADCNCDKVEGPNSENDNDMKSWMSSVKLWNHHANDSPDFNSTSSNMIEAEAVAENAGGAKMEIKGNSGDEVSLMKPVHAVARTVELEQLCGESARNLNRGKTLVHELKMQKKIQQAQEQVGRKQRRCWSPELHRRFVDALQQLGGSEVATPRQIRDIMRVEGLTNDEVKSHLQKYRLHMRKAPAPTASQDDPRQPLHSKSHSIISPQGPLDAKRSAASGNYSASVLDAEEAEEENEGHSWRGGVLFRPACRC